MKLFKIDSPFMVVLTKIADLIIINIFTLFLCVPIITAGAAMTALYYTCLKMRRDEESGIVKTYFSSFRMNFKESTAIWLIMLMVVGIPSVGLTTVMTNFGEATPTAVKILLGGAVLLAIFCFTMTFPVQSRFSNTIGNTIKTGILVGLSNPPRTFLIMIMTVAPFYLTYNFMVLLPMIITFGFSLPAFLAVCLYNKQFVKMEEEANRADGIAPAGTEDEHIFSDEVKSDSEE